MPTPGLQRGETAIGIDRRQLGERRGGDKFNTCASLTQALQAALERPGDFRLQFIQHHRLRHGKMRLRQRFCGTRSGQSAISASSAIQLATS